MNGKDVCLQRNKEIKALKVKMKKKNSLGKKKKETKWFLFSFFEKRKQERKWGKERGNI